MSAVALNTENAATAVTGHEEVNVPTPTAVQESNQTAPLSPEELMEDIWLGDFEQEDETNIISKATLEIKTVIHKLNKLALDYVLKFNEALLKNDNNELAKYKQLMDETNAQLRTFNQTLYRVQPIATQPNPIKSEVDLDTADSFLRLNYKDLPHFQLEAWSRKPYPNEHAYQSVDNYLWDKKKLVNMSSNIALERHWQHILPLVVDDKHSK